MLFVVPATLDRPRLGSHWAVSRTAVTRASGSPSGQPYTPRLPRSQSSRCLSSAARTRERSVGSPSKRRRTSAQCQTEPWLKRLRNEAPGTARIVVDVDREVIVGATITGPEIADFLHAATIALVCEVPPRRLRHAVPAFPTRSELSLDLLEAYGVAATRGPSRPSYWGQPHGGASPAALQSAGKWAAQRPRGSHRCAPLR